MGDKISVPKQGSVRATVFPPAEGERPVSALKAPVPSDPGDQYRATKDSHRLCKQCQSVMTANRDQVCDSCAAPFTTLAEKEALAAIPDAQLGGDLADLKPDQAFNAGYLAARQAVQVGGVLKHAAMTPDEKYADSTQPRLVHYVTWAGEQRSLTVNSVDGKGEVPVPFLAWTRTEDGRLSLTLDHRLGLDLPAMTDFQEDSIIEFIANAIAIGAGYASIYYTKRKMPFRG